MYICTHVFVVRSPLLVLLLARPALVKDNLWEENLWELVFTGSCCRPASRLIAGNELNSSSENCDERPHLLGRRIFHGNNVMCHWPVTSIAVGCSSLAGMPLNMPLLRIE